MRKPIVPAVILLLLVLAMAFRWTRWETVTTQTASDGVAKVSYRVDRWTGQQWTRGIFLQASQVTAVERPAFSRLIEAKNLKAAEKAARDSRKIATNVWYFAILVSGVWLILSLRRGRKQGAAEGIA